MRSRKRDPSEILDENLDILKQVYAQIKESGLATLVFKGEEQGREAQQTGNMLRASFQAMGTFIETNISKDEERRVTLLTIGPDKG